MTPQQVARFAENFFQSSPVWNIVPFADKQALLEDIVSAYFGVIELAAQSADPIEAHARLLQYAQEKVIARIFARKHAANN